MNETPPYDNEKSDDIETLQKLMSLFQGLSSESRVKMIKTIATFFDIGHQISVPQLPVNTSPDDLGVQTGKTAEPLFSQDRTMAPKEFLLEKSPRTDVERVACLAFYLTHYRDTQHFKTIDISKLNTEAAQRKFSNAARAVNNAARSGYLVPSTKGNKQLGALGEVFVQELPDREAAKVAVAKLKPRSRRKKAARKTSTSTS